MSAPDLSLSLGDTATSPDSAAEAAAAFAGVHVRMLTELSELDSVYRLYDSIWQPDPKNPPVTTELLRALTKAGNYVAGAYDGDELVGACVGFFSAPAEVAMHSHVAGVSTQARGRNVGFALKLHQRAWALQRGVTAISWTFDPLVRRNAYFNVVKLAAQPAEYLTNFYGDMHDGINNGDDTDRLLVRWQLDAPAVTIAATTHPVGLTVQTLPEATIALGRTQVDHPLISTAEVSGAGIALDRAPDDHLQLGHRRQLGQQPPLVSTAEVPGARIPTGATGPARSTGPGPAGASDVSTRDLVLVAVPADIEGLRHTDPAAATAWRAALREVLGGLLADGARVTGFDRAGWYVLELPARGLM